MRPHALVKSILMAGLAAMLSGAAPAAPAGNKDDWSRVPPFPTSFYLVKDHFGDEIYAARQALDGEIAARQKFNDESKNKINDLAEQDPMEIARRMQQHLMDHPEEGAQQIRQANEGSNTIRKDYDEKKKLLADLDALRSRYKPQVDKELGSFDAKFKDLDVRASKSLIPCGEVGPAYAPWAVAEYNKLISEKNAAYGRIAAEWWAPSGSFQGWLERYRDHLVQLIPEQEKEEAAQAGITAQLAAAPNSSFKSLVTLEAVGDYMDQARNVFAGRKGFPEPPMQSCGAPSR